MPRINPWTRAETLPICLFWMGLPTLSTFKIIHRTRSTLFIEKLS
jgi:hypothetical protein